jgi:hypothetical protein
VRIAISGAEIEAVIAGIDQGVLTVKLKRTPAKIESPKPSNGRKRAGRNAQGTRPRML